MKVAVLSTLLLLSLVLSCSASFIHTTTADSPTSASGSAPAAPGSVDCDSKCKARCSAAGFQDRCLKYCGICCEECKCVPSGTYGNKHECPCYRDKKNSKGKPKCP